MGVSPLSFLIRMGQRKLFVSGEAKGGGAHGTWYDSNYLEISLKKWGGGSMAAPAYPLPAPMNYKS